MLDAPGDAAGQEYHDDRRTGAEWQAAPASVGVHRAPRIPVRFLHRGQIMSRVAMIDEAKVGWPSAATADPRRPFALADLPRAETRERMSVNLCPCACYPNIVDAVAEAAARS
jgi:xanthine dehydrogenase YagT iron-sulfur-binding subunit